MTKYWPLLTTSDRRLRGPATAQAEHILELLLSHGFPIRKEKRTRAGDEVQVYSYETSAGQVNPVKYFAPLKKKFLSEKKRQDDKWLESLFWQLPDITQEAQNELGVNGGIFASFAPNDLRTAQERQTNASPKYQFPHRPAASTRKLYKVYPKRTIPSQNASPLKPVRRLAKQLKASEPS